MNAFVFAPFIEGFGTGAGLIMAIGAQNIFVLKQGILKNHVFATVFLCALIDAVLIALGVGGFGTLLNSNPYFITLAKWGGFSFLAYYGFRAFRSVLTPHAMVLDGSRKKPSLKATCVMVLTFSLLNPHVYLDTVVLLGSISAQWPIIEQPSFVYGSITASFLWFFAMGYGAQFLASLFKKPAAWKVLDFITGCIMWGIAVSLLMWTHEGG
ncbi:MAG: LysE/ArgO family amino acid transporter [Alphaproteobacteria bacterium]|nr:LysE/ArgO family amino acid transporter [Alphaproteobacteria bacterium]